ncbi:redoxin family protein [Prevotella sp. 10(H)]|uniref:TlpA family protein disulfide reductase n=1 Tax=Prevotella sp. 10(H) TaxID=1158294 RepID=UPI0004A6B68D|nr:redoxin family protein [Prevotella sp. 10(H)]
MNVLKVICFFSLLVLAGCDKSPDAAIISGKIEGKSIDSIEYSLPVNGVSFTGFTGKTAVDSLGNFTISLIMEKPAIISLMGFGSGKKIIIEPAQKYDLHIKADDNNSSLSITGLNEEGNKLFSELPNPPFLEMELRKYGRNASLDSMKTDMAAKKAEAIGFFKKLLDEKKVSAKFYDMVGAELDCYYAALETLAHYSKMDFSGNLKEQSAALDSIYSQYPPDSERLMASSYWYQYADRYITVYKEIAAGEYNQEKLREIYEAGKIYTYFVENSKKNFTGLRLEYFIAAYLYFQSIQKNYEAELITLYNQFKTDYPDSKYIVFLEPLINEIADYQKKISADFSENMKFVPDYQNINTLKELISLFKGKKLYIDIWATWCGPCKTEFKYNKELKEILKEKGMESIYISIDEDRNDKQWKDMIKFYSLEGNHVRVNKALDADLRKVFDRDGMIAIPWYIMVDENGTIIEKHAKAPSQLIKDK